MRILCRKNLVMGSLDNIPDNLQMKNLLEIRQKSMNDGTYFSPGWVEANFL